MQFQSELTGMSLTLDCLSVATWFDLWATWCVILVAQIDHLKFYELVLGPPYKSWISESVVEIGASIAI